MTEWHEIYDDVSKIAPTVKLHSYGWDRLEDLAQILDRETEKEEFKKTYDNTVAATKDIIKTKMNETDSTLLIALYENEQIGVTEMDFVFNQLLYDQLGFTTPPNTIQTDGQGSMSIEGLVAVNPDILFILKHDEQSLDSLLANSAVQQISAVKNNRVYIIDSRLARNVKGNLMAIDVIVEEF